MGEEYAFASLYEQDEKTSNGQQGMTYSMKWKRTRIMADARPELPTP